ncbi:hypothetical protein P3T65_26380 [Pseudomonas nitroreducens]|uniref:hypothetical protein n=1 Tax=Pseudomonas nitroreducens TaxID=46680 RepID=UPI0023F9A37E|nr:hypothetical protein [Pseudomonas nitroreducens]WEW97715.1 hypothetical protein P3T65_26380 [Pseudomonas nitroreducens]
MTPARQESLVQGLNGVARKVFDCIPIAEAWKPFQVMAAMRRLTGSTPDAQIVSGCLTKLVDSGLIKKCGRDAYQRRAVEQKQKPQEQKMTAVAAKPAQQVEAKPAASPLDLIGELASDIAAAGESLKRLAKRAEDVALMVEQDREVNAKAMAGYRQLKSLLKDLQGDGV